MTIVELEGEWMYHPILQNVLVVGEDGNDYIIMRRVKLPKNTIYPTKDFYLEGIKNAKTNRGSGSND